jgi:hypothetical protein
MVDQRTEVMPFVNGTMYAEAREQFHDFGVLNVLLLGSASGELQKFIIDVSTLHAYVTQTLRKEVKINIHTTGAYSDALVRNFSLTTHIFNPLSADAIKEKALSSDIDVVLDQDDVLGKRYVQDNFYVFQTVKTLNELISSCEDFLVGNDIPWLFSDIAWNTPLFMRYYSRPGVCTDYFKFMGECTETKGYTSEQQEKVRYIANRIAQIEYSKDLIHSYIKRVRKAERNGFPDQDFNLELNYHLGNYYFLMAGVLDSMARLLNDVLRLGLNRRLLALEKEPFVDKNRRKRTGLVRILTNKDFVKWINFLKERRHFIAHDGDMRQSPLVVQNDILMSDQEVESKIDEKMDWAFAATVHTPELIQALRAQFAEIIRIKGDFREIARNAMIVPNDDGHKVYQPLRSIDHDYEQLAAVLSKFLVKLRR